MKLEEVKEDLSKGVSLDLVLIPAGKFVMGASESEKEKYGLNDERDGAETQHEVTLTKPFYMGKYAVTQEQWEAVIGTGFLWFGGNPSYYKGRTLPVTDVSWNDCQEFIMKLNAKTSGGYRLPTEAEWEYACRAGTTTAYSVGDSITKADANIGEGWDDNKCNIKAVGSYKPNAFGLYDMHGNVHEWCEDWYGEYPAGAITDPKGPARGEYRVTRGGSYIYEPDARSACRNRYGDPTMKHLARGFRLVLNTL